MKVKNTKTNILFEAEKGLGVLSGYYWVSPLIFNAAFTVNSFLVFEKEFEQTYEVVGA